MQPQSSLERPREAARPASPARQAPSQAPSLQGLELGAALCSVLLVTTIETHSPDRPEMRGPARWTKRTFEGGGWAGP